MKDEDLDLYRAKVLRIAEGRDQHHGPWSEVFSANEVLPIIKRLDAAEAALSMAVRE